MSVQDLILGTQWLFLGYFMLLNGGYILLNFSSLFGMREYFSASSVDSLPKAYSEYELPISILVPAYNEAGNHHVLRPGAAATALSGIRDRGRERRVEGRNARRADPGVPDGRLSGGLPAAP